MCTHTHTHLCTLSHTHALIKYCFTWRFYKRKLPFFKTLARCTVAFCCRHFVSQTMACTYCRVCFCVCVCASECVGVSIFPCDNSLLWHTLRAWHSHSHSQPQSQLALFFCARVCGKFKGKSATCNQVAAPPAALDCIFQMNKAHLHFPIKSSSRNATR